MPRAAGLKQAGKASNRPRKKKPKAGAKTCRILLQRPLAMLEKLPVEILHQIFTTANFELNLAKTSWYLMSCIQSHPVYKIFMAFSSFWATRVSGSKHAKFKGNPLLEGLPRLPQDERLSLQQELFSGKCLKPSLWRTIQFSFFRQLLRARWNRLRLEKGYGPLTMRRNRRAGWEGTRGRDTSSHGPDKIPTAHYSTSSGMYGLIRFHPDLTKDVVEIYDFPAVEARGCFRKAPVPDEWFLNGAKKSREERLMIVSIVGKRYWPDIPFPKLKAHYPKLKDNLRRVETRFDSFMIHAAINERRIDILALHFFPRSPQPSLPGHLSAFAISRSHLFDLMFVPTASKEEVRMVMLLWAATVKFNARQRTSCIENFVMDYLSDWSDLYDECIQVLHTEAKYLRLNWSSPE